MFETLLISSIMVVLITIVVLLIFIKLQQRKLNDIQISQQAWRRAQDIQQRRWREQQEQHIQELEKTVKEQLQQLQQGWQEWLYKDSERVEKLTQQYTSAEIRTQIAHLPLIDEAPLPQSNGISHRGDTLVLPSPRLPSLEGAQLSHYNLSHRYLRHANLRGAQLVNTDLFMADLSGAYLVDADLSGANLCGANLVGADLRGAKLTGANLLVADMNNAILLGANLLQARNLSVAQIRSAVYDYTTHFNNEIELTLPFMPAITKHSSLPRSPLSSLPDTPLPHSAQSSAMSDDTASSAASSPPPADDSQKDQEEQHLPEDMPENTHTEAVDITIPNTEHNDTEQAEGD